MIGSNGDHRGDRQVGWQRVQPASGNRIGRGIGSRERDPIIRAQDTGMLARLLEERLDDGIAAHACVRERVRIGREHAVIDVDRERVDAACAE